MLHEDEIQSYKFDLEDIFKRITNCWVQPKERYKSVSHCTKRSIVPQSTEGEHCHGHKNCSCKYIRFATMKEVMCNEMKKYSQDFAVRELEHNPFDTKNGRKVARNEHSECAAARRNQDTER